LELEFSHGVASVNFERIFWPLLCALLVFHWIGGRDSSTILVAYYGAQPGEPAKEVRYAADVVSQKVRYLDPTLGGFTFDVCTVLDARNWRCELTVPSDWPAAAYVVTDGDITITDKKNFISPESWLKWESARLLGPLAKMWGAI
jgi:hypothetical protein